MIEVGSILSGRYEILEKIGTGGMSDVFKALDTALGREVAVKVLKEDYVTDMDFVSKFRQEAKAAAGLEHPNIVNVYDVGNEEGNYFIVMEYIEGITLKTYIAKKKILNYSELLSIAIQVGRGIEAAHNKQIIHRDIKPQNIIISKEGKVKVTDFGIARAVTSNTINADRMGSVHYSSPEQARNGFVTYQSDIYSLGIMMYEMATGRLPFDGDTTVAVAILHLQSEIIPPSQLVEGVPIAVEKIILRATMKNPERRYENMGQMLTDLKKAMVSPDEDFVIIPPASLTPSSEDIVSAAGITIPEKNEPTEDTAPVIKKAKPKSVSVYEEDDDEDDEEDEAASGMDKAITIMGIAAAIIIVLIVVYLLGSFFGIFRFGKKPVTDSVSTSSESGEVFEVPDVLGRDEKEAKKIVEDAGFVYKKLGESSSEEYDEGQIMEQNPAGNKKVKEGTTIEVLVSSGKGTESVPDVVGLTQADAISQIEDKGFICKTEQEFNENVEQGRVIRQSPTSKEKAKEKDTITIWISRGTEQVAIPNVVGKSQSVATAELTTAGFSVRVENANDNTVPKGQVISQSASGQATKGSDIIITISLGPETPKQKYTTTMTISPVNGEDTFVVLLDDNGDLIEQRTLFDSVTISIRDIPTQGGTITYFLNDDRNILLKGPEKITFQAQ